MAVKMRNKKADIWAVIIMAWLIVLSLVYLIVMKFKLFFK